MKETGACLNLPACLYILFAAIQFIIPQNASCAAAAINTNQPSVLDVAPYLQNLSETGVTIVWHSDRQSYGFVEYGEDATLGRKAESVRDGLKVANVEWHQVRIPDLKPGTSYHYRVVDRAIVSFGPYKTVFAPDTVSDTRVFTTPAVTADKVRCVIFNDLHNRTSLAKKLADAIPGHAWDMAIFNGDIFADINRETNAFALITGFIDAVDGRSRQAVFVRGNHETRGAWARRLHNAVVNPDDRFYFAFTRGPVRFVMLDCGEDKSDDNKSYSGLNDFSAFRAEEGEWLKREVASTAFLSARYRVLVHHIPLYSEKINDTTGDISVPCRNLWGPTVEKAGFDLAINGHTHTLTSIKAGVGGNPFPVLIGSGPEEKNAVVMLLEADMAKLKVQAIDVSGRVMFECECLPKR